MEGYAKLAHSLMGNSRTDGRFLIFQKFESLSAQNLLYLQAEIVNLQVELTDIVQEDSKCADVEKRSYTRDWWSLSSIDVGRDNKQWRKWLELRGKMKEYYSAIEQHAMLTKLPNPHKRDLDFLREWVERPTMGNQSFSGADRNIYMSSAEDLVSLAKGATDTDPFTRWLTFSLDRYYHKMVVDPIHRISNRWIKKPEENECGSRPVSTAVIQATNTPSTSLVPANVQSQTPVDGSNSSAISTTETASTDNSNNSSTAPVNNLNSSAVSATDTGTAVDPAGELFDIEANIFLYRDSHVLRLANILGSAIASVVPLTAIVVLYFVTNLLARIGIVCGFTAVFSVALSLTTEARRIEIFAATAAFASVQVVFVGTTKLS